MWQARLTVIRHTPVQQQPVSARHNLAAVCQNSTGLEPHADSLRFRLIAGPAQDKFLGVLVVASGASASRAATLAAFGDATRQAAQRPDDREAPALNGRQSGPRWGCVWSFERVAGLWGSVGDTTRGRRTHHVVKFELTVSRTH